ncbi:MAG: recombination protein RecR [Gammaproteobacteria bacterium]|nr:recombination protein RecR [Gammaproteobacteria bacterium]
MLGYSPLIRELIDALQCLPGVGPRSAQRMALFLLEKNRDGGMAIANSLLKTLANIKNCQQCRTLTEYPICGICNNPNRNSQLICIVETPADMLAIEKTCSYNGRYFVLLGRLSPLDGIGPEQLGLQRLWDMLLNNQASEIVLATNLTVEGEATAHYLTDCIKLKFANILITRIAHGVPVGGELEYVDGGTLAQALTRRSLVIDAN